MPAQERDQGKSYLHDIEFSLRTRSILRQLPEGYSHGKKDEPSGTLHLVRVGTVSSITSALARSAD